MRAIKRAIKTYKKNKAMRPALDALNVALQKEFGQGLSLKRGGDRGRDSVFNVRDTSGAMLGVARLMNTQRDRKTINPAMPYRRIKAAERLAYEWESCEAGHAQHLTPKPLWQNDTAIMVSFCEGGSYQAHFIKHPELFWDYIIRASKALKQWHALGRVHMDTSLTNVVGDAEREHAYLIDFEYIPADHLTKAQAKAYDFLRLVESSYKFVPEHILAQYEDWQQFLETELDEETKSANLTPLIPAIKRVYTDTHLTKVIETIFTNHHNS